MTIDKKLLWTQSGIAAATNGSILHPFDITGISIDSRTAVKGDLFIALKAKKDGHHFIKNAFEKGVSAALIGWRPRNTPKNAPLIFVKNTMHALNHLAMASRARCRGKIIAVTGSVGKTTVKEITSSLLSSIGTSHSAQKSYNNHIGVPLTLARMPADTQYGVFEVGMDHAGEITPLTKMVRPHIAVITTVGPSHIGNFDSVEGIAHAKAEIFNGVVSGGTVILNRDNTFYSLLESLAQEKSLNIISFGFHEESHCRILNSHSSENTHQLTLGIKDKEYALKTSLLGEHNAYNIAASFSILDHLECDLEKSVTIMETLSPVAGRGETHILPWEKSSDAAEQKTITLVDESYNANPLSMSAALRNIQSLKTKDGGLKIAILGQMGDLGDKSSEYHTALSQDVLACQFDRIYMIGKDMEVLYDALGEEAPAICALDLLDIQEEILQEITSGSIVFVKGSNSNGLTKIIDILQEKADNFNKESL